MATSGRCRRRSVCGVAQAAVAAVFVASQPLTAAGSRLLPDQYQVQHVSELRFDEDEETIIYADGRRVKVRQENGTFIMPDGTRVDPFKGLDMEGVLPREAFVCHNGRLFGIRLPLPAEEGKSWKTRVKMGRFHYVFRNHLPNVDPVEIYLEVGNQDQASGGADKVFMIIPPTDDLTRTYTMLYRTAKKGAEEFTLERLFRMTSDRHPCDDEPKPEETLPADDAQPEAPAVKGSPEAEDAESQKPAADEDFYAYVGVDPRASGAGGPKPGPVANAALRDLLADRWWPMAFLKLN